jgi:hypothetical protein
MMHRTSLCVACVEYGIVPADLAVDPSSRSPNEADALCRTHRARMTEGYCVLCARKEPWVSPWTGSAIGCCKPCFVERFGGLLGEEVEAEFAQPASLDQRPPIVTPGGPQGGIPTEDWGPRTRLSRLPRRTGGEGSLPSSGTGR